MLLYRLYRKLLWVQGTYMVLTALWGLLDIHSFMVVTGPKTDVWLVKTVSVLILCLSILFFSNLAVHSHPLPVVLTGMSASAGLAFIDFYYTLNETIRWVYAVDGGVEAGFFCLWAYLYFRKQQWIKDFTQGKRL